MDSALVIIASRNPGGAGRMMNTFDRTEGVMKNNSVTNSMYAP